MDIRYSVFLRLRAVATVRREGGPGCAPERLPVCESVRTVLMGASIKGRAGWEDKS